MKKIFQAIALVSVLICAAYGACVILKKFLFDDTYQETTEFDDLYNEFIAQHS